MSNDQKKQKKVSVEFFWGFFGSKMSFPLGQGWILFALGYMSLWCSGEAVGRSPQRSGVRLPVPLKLFCTKFFSIFQKKFFLIFF